MRLSSKIITLLLLINMTKKIILILTLFLASTLTKADTNEGIARITKDGYLLNPIISLPIYLHSYLY